MSDTQNMEQAQEVQHSPKFEDIKGVTMTAVSGTPPW